MVEETGRSLRGYLSGAAPLAQYANPLGFLPGVPVQNYDPMATYDQSTQEALRNLIQTGIEMGPQDLDPNTGQPLGRPGISDPAVGSDILSTYGRAAGYLQPGLPLPATYQTISDTIGDAAIVPVPNPHADLHTIYSPYDFQPWGSGAARDRPTGAQGYGFGQLGLWLAEKIGKTAATLGAEPLPLATEYLPRVRTDTFEAQSPQDFAVGDESMVSTEWNPWIPLGEEGWRPNLQGDTIGGPEVGVETPEQIMASNVAQALATQTPRGMPGSARVTPELQALVELAQTDPTIAERYTTPGSQDLIDIATQVESFSAIQERADQERVERERADNRRAADEAAARQEQVRADNQRRAEESARAAENARSEREEAQRSADRAAEAAERSRSAQASRQARATAKRAEKAAAKERQATIQRQEDNRRRQATERAAAAQRQAEQQRERQAAARARNIAAENRLRSTMGGTNYAAYLRRGK